MNQKKISKELNKYIPGGCHTYSKGDDQFPSNAPSAIIKGKGSKITGSDGKKYLDCGMGLSSVSLGHAFSDINIKVKKELDKGVNFNRPSLLELDFAKNFLSLMPQHEMIKFSKNGSTVTTAAIKLARAKTNRKLVAFPLDHPFYSYDDWFIGKTKLKNGVPNEISKLSVGFKSCSLSSLKSLIKKYGNKLACVIMEPQRPHCNFSCKCNIDVKDYLKEAIKITHKNGSIFILDEMITGYKVGFPGAITQYNLNADLATWGKGISNGFSFCALTGKKNIMDLGGIKRKGSKRLFLISTTHGAETHAIVAANETLKIFRKKKVIKYNQKVGKTIISTCDQSIKKIGLEKNIKIIGSNWYVSFEFYNKSKKCDYLKTLFLKIMIQKKILFQGSFVPSYSHTTEDILFFCKKFEETLFIIKSKIDLNLKKIVGNEVIKPVFRVKN